MKIFFIFLIGLLCVPVSLALSEEAKEEPVEISLSTMILFAMDQNPNLNIAREKGNQMGYFIEEGKAAYYPQLDVNMSGGKEYVNSGGGKDLNNPAKASVTLNQNIFNGFQTSSEIKRREELKKAANINLDLKKSEIILEVIKHYLGVMRYSKLEKRTEIFVGEIDDVVDMIADMVEAGAAGKVMLDYAQSRQAAAYVLLNEARSSLNDSMSNLEFLTGALPDFKAIAPDYLEPNRLDKEVYIDTAATDSSLMVRALSETEAMRLQVEAEEGGFLPSVDLAVKAEQTHDDGGDVGRLRNLKATVNMTYQLFDGFEKKNRLGRVSSQLTELEYQEEKLFNEIKRDIDLSYNQVSSIQEAMKATNAEILSNSTLQRLNRENFRLGEINAIELIEGEERLQSAYASKYKLEQELYTNIYNLLVNSSIIKERYFCDTCGEGDEL